MIPGAATTIGTRRYASRFRTAFSPDFYRPALDRLTAASIGMGTYLGDCDDAEDDRYAALLAEGIRNGLNVLDTAINYRCQRSERAVGRALAEVIGNGVASRDEIVVCTKGGYIPLDGAPPDSRSEYDAYLDTEYFTRGTMGPGDVVSGGHCLNPQFIANQIERSRSNLGVETIDLFYLHNPEQELDSFDRDQFTAIMRTAFEELESQVAAGSIKAYGCATWNGFRVAPAHRSHLSLTDLVSLAARVGGDAHHFRAIQLPVNLAMTEAIRSPTQMLNGKPASVLDLARELGISVFASASLMQSQLTRDLPPAVKTLFPALSTDAQRAIAFVRSLPVSTALVGMKTIPHLKENLTAGSAVIQV
jgi:aryl-alcohol dehydrogenase-like predicted oxidoreductase